MTVVRALAVLIVLTVATPAAAQVAGQAWPPTRGASAFDQHRYAADRHRYETDRLRLQADQREALARQLQLEAQLNGLRVEAGRRPEPLPPVAAPILRSSEEERALRQSATARRQASTASVGQIDAWLDRVNR